jgi:hypothetical protein
MRKSDGTILGGQRWSPVKAGGLGMVTGGDIASDGTYEVCRTDVGGAYKRESTTDTWTLITTASVMTLPPFSNGLSDDDSGIYEVAIAPSSVGVCYLGWRGRMMRSTDRAVTFADDSLNGSTGLYMTTNDGQNRTVQNKLRVDPSNAAVAYLGTQNNGLWRRLTAGWSQVSTASVPISSETSDADKTVIVAVDPTSSTTGSAPDVRRSVVYCSVNKKGLYKSTDGGGTFSLISGHPGAGVSFRASCLICDQTGKIWLCVDNGATGNLYTSANGGTSWTQVTSAPAYNVNYVVVDPKDSTRIVGLCAGSAPITSTNGGTTWAGPYFPTHCTAVANQCVLTAIAANSLFNNGQGNAIPGMLPHPTRNIDRMWNGWGTFYFNSPWPAPASRSLVFYEDTKGIEELVSYHVSILPSGTTFCCSGDRGIVRQDKNGGYATVNWPPNVPLTDSTNVDWAIDNPNYCVQQTIRGGLNDTSGYSTDEGITWTVFPTQPNTGSGGHIAISNTNQIVNFRAQNFWPRYTTNGGTTWNDCVFAGFTRVADGTENGFGFGSPFTYRRHIVCADKAHAGTFYCYNYGIINGIPDNSLRGVWKSTNGGVNWSKMGDPGTTQFGWHAELFITGNGHLYICTGPLSVTTIYNGGQPSFRSEDGGVTWTELATLSDINCLAWGAPKPGNAVPYALYALGWSDASTFGLFRSDDKGQTWLQLTMDPVASINGSSSNAFTWPQCMGADPGSRPEAFGRVVVGYSGNGFSECVYNYTLTLS